MLPMPNEAISANTANRAAVRFMFKPFSSVYMGPPATLPSGETSRNFSARVHSVNLVAMPKKAVTHIQKRAPGPPRVMAVATPAMLPVPMVADRAVDNAWKCDTSPLSSRRSIFPLPGQRHA